MDVAFVEDAENDIDSHESGQNQKRLVYQRCLKRLGRSLKTGLNARRHPQLLLGFIDGAYCIAKRSTGRKIERNVNHGKLALMIDGKRSVDGLQKRKGTNGNSSAGIRLDEKMIEILRIIAKVGMSFQHDMILIQLRKDRRNLALAERIIKRIVERLR